MQRHLIQDCEFNLTFPWKCPFACKESEVDIKLNNMTLERHITTNCSSLELRCPDCDLNIYSIYKDLDFDKVDPDSRAGHDCIRDLKEEVKQLKATQNLPENLYQSVDKT